MSDEMMWRPPGEPVVVDAVQVVFEPAEAGWQPVRMMAGGRAASFRASHIFDPFRRILSWLEAIACNDQGRVSADLEGTELELFAFRTHDPARVRIVATIVWGWRKEFRDIELDIDVDRRGLVSAFYNAFRAYADSDKYVVNEWAALSMREDLIRKKFPGDPMTQMASCDAATLNEMLRALYPIYTVSFPSAPTVGDQIRRFAEYAISGERPDDMVEKPEPRFDVPPEFDGWDAARRVKCINKLLDEFVTPYDGSNLATLRSPIVEVFLRTTPKRP